jgi:TonB family protein
MASTGAGAASGAVSFDGGDFPYDAFIARMRQKIAAAWQVPGGSAGIERFAIVYFRVHRDGDITHVSVEQPSGVFLFDQSCQRAVIAAAPFPPLPREYVNEYVGVHFSFKYVPAQTP